MRVPFNKLSILGPEPLYIADAVNSGNLAGDGPYGKKCQKYFDETLGSKTLLTPSCTHALEMAAILLNISVGDEVIMPSFTFVSTANAFVMRGAKVTFVDIRPDTMNIDEKKIEQAINKRTKAIVVVHYAGVACEMNTIMEIAHRHNIYVIEDAAQAIQSKYEDVDLGTIGHIGAYSFHETKNITSGGEGGLIIINNPDLIQRAEVIREKGTNRSQFYRGQVDKYSWLDIGSSYLPSELQAAYLWAQIECLDQINSKRLHVWNYYHGELAKLEISGDINRPIIPDTCAHNGHIYYIKVADIDTRQLLIEHLKQNGVQATFHYVPLHSAPAGSQLSQFHGKDIYTTKESERLLRLPLFYGITEAEMEHVVKSIKTFF